MDTKLSILLLFAIVAQSAIAFDISLSSCTSGTKIGNALSQLKFGQDAATTGYKRSLDVLFKEITTVLGVRCGAISTDCEDADWRTELAQNESYQGLLFGIIPTLQAMKLLQPELDIDFVNANWSATLEDLNNLYFSGIKAAQSSDYTNASAEIAGYLNTALAAADVLFGGSFEFLLAGNTPTAVSITECFWSRVLNEAKGGLRAIFKAIRILLDAHFNCTTKAEYYNYLSQIDAAHNKAYKLFVAEVVEKFSVVRNLILREYLKKIGTLQGLFDIDAAAGQKFV